MPLTASIGLIAGSGPDAGVDLWAKVLSGARRVLGVDYHGDESAPRVEIISEPALGASLHLPATDQEVWDALARSATLLGERCDVYAVACNTLNVYAARLRALPRTPTFVSFPDAVASWARRTGTRSVGLLAARPVAALGEWSAYRDLAGALDVESARDLDEVHRLIEAVKADGGADPRHRQRLRRIVEGFESAPVLLACTELPLVAEPVPGHELVDVTDLVAEELVRRWIAIGSE